jgi:cation diffusion facilitator family transporter
MTKLLIKLFIGRKAAGEEPAQLREAYGSLSGIVGIAMNLLLGAVKLIIGIIGHSVAVMADAINNLTDAGSSLLTIIGFRFAAKQSDEKHPFGHARAEYMTGVIISAVIIVVGIRLAMSSFERILNPSGVSVNTIGIIFLFAFSFIKLWLWRFNLTLGKVISSAALKATGIDARNDVISTAVVLLSLLFYNLTKVDIDGYVGVAVAAFIVISGLALVKETVAPLLGQPPDPVLVKSITNFVLDHDGAMGVHDLVVHDYGPGHIFATVHVEVDAYTDIMLSHEMLDDIERDAKQRLSVELVCHMDPIDTKDPLVFDLRELMTRVLVKVDGVRGLHDFRIVRGPNRTNVIFDVVLSQNREIPEEPEITAIIQKALTDYGPSLKAVVNYDLDYSAESFDKAFHP